MTIPPVASPLALFFRICFGGNMPGFFKENNEWAIPKNKTPLKAKNTTLMFCIPSPLFAKVQLKAIYFYLNVC